MSIQIMNFVALGPMPLKGGLKVGVILPKSQANESYIVRNVSNMFLTPFALPTFRSEVYLRGLRNFSQRASTKLADSQRRRRKQVLCSWFVCFQNLLQYNSTSLHNDMDAGGSIRCLQGPSTTFEPCTFQLSGPQA